MLCLKPGLYIFPKMFSFIQIYLTLLPRSPWMWGIAMCTCKLCLVLLHLSFQKTWEFSHSWSCYIFVIQLLSCAFNCRYGCMGTALNPSWLLLLTPISKHLNNGLKRIIYLGISFPSVKIPRQKNSYLEVSQRLGRRKRFLLPTPSLLWFGSDRKFSHLTTETTFCNFQFVVGSWKVLSLSKQFTLTPCLLIWNVTCSLQHIRRRGPSCKNIIR